MTSSAGSPADDNCSQFSAFVFSPSVWSFSLQQSSIPMSQTPYAHLSPTMPE